MQRVQSNALDWEPLFLNSFPMFGRNMLHATGYPEEDVETYEYKGTAFTCMEDALAPDNKANCALKSGGFSMALKSLGCR